MPAILTSIVVLSALSSGPPGWTVNSDWETRYEDFQGRSQVARIELRNGAGKYGQRGQLLNSFFYESVQHPSGEITPALIGEWRMDGLRGYFVFRAPEKNGKMNGYWGQFDSRGRPSKIIGSWDGVLLRELPLPMPAMTPVPAAIDAPQLNVTPLPKFSPLPKAEARFGDNSQLVDLNWVNKLNDRKLQVGALSLLVGMNVRVKGKAEYHPAGEQFGTCFLVGKGVGITARHCIDVLSMPSQVNATFLHPSGVGQEVHALAADPIPLQTLDAAILLFDPQQGTWPKEFVSLTEALDEQGKISTPRTKTPLIVQYPGRQGWRMSFGGEFIDAMKPNQYLYYTAPTDEGSSGAPVFGSDWQIMAVHSGVDAESNAGARVDLVVKEIKRMLTKEPRHQKILAEIGL